MAGATRMREKLKSFRGEALREVKHWRFVVSQSLNDESNWSAPMCFLAKAFSGEVEVEIWTDATTSLGGGYHIPLVDTGGDSAGHFGQVLWSEEERLLFGAADLEATDINVLEFVTAILTVVSERELLRGRVVRINVDNTAAISWLNKLRAKHVHGQVWVALLVYLCFVSVHAGMSSRGVLSINDAEHGVPAGHMECVFERMRANTNVNTAVAY